MGADTLELAGAGGGVGGAGDCWVTSLSGAGVDGSDLTSLLSSTSFRAFIICLNIRRHVTKLCILHLGFRME